MADESDLERKIAQRLGRRLAELRMSRGMTQEQVAHAAGVSRNHYQAMERGLSDRASQRPANPTLSTLRGIAGVLGLSVTELLAALLAEEPLESGGALEAGRVTDPRASDPRAADQRTQGRPPRARRPKG